MLNEPSRTIFHIMTQVDRYGIRIRRCIHTIYAPYTTVFHRITWHRITIVYVRDRILNVYAGKRASFENLRYIDHDFLLFIPPPPEIKLVIIS